MKQIFSLTRCGLALFLGCVAGWAQKAEIIPGNQRNPYVRVEVERPILLFSADGKAPTTTKLKATAVNFAPSAKLTYQWEQFEDSISPAAAKIGEGKKIVFSAPTEAETQANFSGSGVYVVRLTVKDAAQQVTVWRNSWVNVWNPKSQIVRDGKEDPLGSAPGLNPPPSVRQVSPDPGPFSHPRILCTNEDWPEISQRCSKGVIAGNAFQVLDKNVDNKLGDAEAPFAQLTRELVVYAEAGFQGKSPDLTMGIPAEGTPEKPDWSKAYRNLLEYEKLLRDACFVSWVKQDPRVPWNQIPADSQARMRTWAKAIAALGHLHLRLCWNEATGEFNKNAPLYIRDLDNLGWSPAERDGYALAYDFASAWMTEAEQRAARDFLFAIGAGRTTGARSVHFAPGIHRRVQKGFEQNGDFMNIEEAKVFTYLAVEGEESGVSEKVKQAFIENIPKPNDYMASPHFEAYDWAQLAEVAGERAQEGAQPYPEGIRWPHARKVAIDNLRRANSWCDEGNVSPWGGSTNRQAYNGFSMLGLAPAAVAHAVRGGFNQYVASHYYQMSQYLIYCLYPSQGPLNQSENFTTRHFLFDHHDGGWDYRQVHVLLMKYMYPDDPLVDYIYAIDAAPFESKPFVPFYTALFGLDPGLNGKQTELPLMAAQKALPLTRLDPQQGIVALRSGWKEEDMRLLFDAGWAPAGHQHAEKNSFAFHALGRTWSMSPGYHVVPANYQTGILIQDPAYASCPLTEGYVGQSPSDVPEGSSYPKCFPTPPAKLVEVRDGPDQLWTLIVGDAKTAYDFCFGPGPDRVDSGKTLQEHMYPGFLELLTASMPGRAEGLAQPISMVPNYNPVSYAFRTVLFVRGERPYVFVVDDIKKEEKPRNYRWTMNCTQAFGPPAGVMVDEEGKAVKSSLLIAPDATAQQATLLHLSDQADSAGTPRLLVREFSTVAAAPQPVMAVTTLEPSEQQRDRTYARRFTIDRNNVVEPKYKVLLFPYRVGEKLPVTQWNEKEKQLSINLQNGFTDVLRLDDTQADHRTRLEFKRQPTP